MQGNQAVIDYMNELLSGELAARDQYFIHSRLYSEWGYNKLFERLNHEMEEETTHAEDFIRRILMLGGTPQIQVMQINRDGTWKPMSIVDMLNAKIIKGVTEHVGTPQIPDFEAIKKLFDHKN